MLFRSEIQADGKKGTFFYTADQRVDFRELIKLYANDFKLKVEMRQIGARQESGKVGGIGSCGRELCCSTWLTDFKSVNTTAARYQNLSINQTKLSGQCGRLKCCLNYELDTYMDALSVFPNHAESLDTVKGIAHLQKRDIFKNLMWYSFSDNNKQYPLSIDRVKEILKMNKQGQKADELQPVELEIRSEKGVVKAIDMGFVNDVGQITLKNLEKNSKKKKSGGGNKPQQGNRPGAAPQGAGGGQQRNRPNRPQQANAAPNADGTPAAPQQQQKNRPNQGGNRPQQTNPDGTPAAPQQQRNRPNRPQGGAAPNADGTPAPQQQPKNKPNQQGQGPKPQGPRPNQGPRPQQGRPNPNADNSAQESPKGENEQGKQQGPRPQQQNRPKQQQRQGPPRQKPPQEPPAPSV